jgi:actin-related protein
VIDSGSATCKIGFAGSARPTAVFATAIARNEQGDHILPSSPYTASPFNRKRGRGATDRANAQRQRQALTWAVQRGLVVDWEAMEQIWRHAFTVELQVEPSEHALLLTEPPLHPKASRGILCRYSIVYCHLHSLLLTGLRADSPELKMLTFSHATFTRLTFYLPACWLAPISCRANDDANV